MKRALPFFLLCFTSHFSLAGSFGVYDARSQAMGGASVAIGSVDLAAGHNPSLLALYNEDEDKSRNGRAYFFPIVGSVSEVGIDGYELLADELDIAFSDALAEYNGVNIGVDDFTLWDERDANAASLAATASNAASRLEQGLSEVANKNISFSLFLPIIAIAEPSKKGGGGFYVGTRVEAGGKSSVPDEDIELFRNYVDALDNVAEGNDFQTINPNLFDGHPACDRVDPNPTCTPLTPRPLTDPFNTVTARGDIIVLMINEIAVASAWGVDYDNMRFAAGITPKAMQVRIFDESRSVSRDALEITNDSEAYLLFNADIGLALEFDNGIRVGYTGKDLFSRTFESTAGNNVKLSTKHRLGLGYVRPKWQLGIDYDIKTGEPLSEEKPGKFISIGGEYSLLNNQRYNLHLRAGYRYDTNGAIPEATSFGLGLDIWSIHMSASYLTSSDEQGAGLQIGYGF